MFPSHPPCESGDGVRLCGGSADCPALPAPTCAGFGCTPALDITSFMPSAAGVCWSDVPGGAAELCYGCPDGDVCAQRESGELVCVSQDVCDALYKLGATDVCRYADKSHCDDQPLAEPEGACPDTSSPRFLCGGACGGCGEPGPCTGRSPAHPYGICANVDDNGAVVPCGVFPQQPACQFDVSLPPVPCGVFNVPAADQPAAQLYGLCDPDCLAHAQILPGGYKCYAADGTALN